MVQGDGPVGLDRVEVVFDDQRAVSDAGIVLSRRWRSGWGSRRSRRVSCASASGSGRPMPGAR